jgi:WD40 repeat protein
MDKNVIFHPFTESTKQHIMTQKRYHKSLTSLTLGNKELVVTGGEDEDLKIWDVSSLPGDAPTTIATVEGHCGEISSIKSLGGVKGKGWVAISTSLDGTLRRWTLQGTHSDLSIYEMLKYQTCWSRKR